MRHSNSLRSKLVDGKVRECNDLPHFVTNSWDTTCQTCHPSVARGRLVSPGSGSSSKGTSSTGLTKYGRMSKVIGSWSIPTVMKSKIPNDASQIRVTQTWTVGSWCPTTKQVFVASQHVCAVQAKHLNRGVISCTGMNLPDPNVSRSGQNKKHAWYMSRKSHETAHTRDQTPHQHVIQWRIQIGLQSMAIATMNHDRFRSITSFGEHQESQHQFDSQHQEQLKDLNLSRLHFLHTIKTGASSLAPSSCEGINEQDWSTNEWRSWTSVNHGHTKHLQMRQFQGFPQRDLPDHCCHQRPGAGWYNWCSWCMALLGSARCIVYLSTWFAWIMWFLSATAKNMRVPIGFLGQLAGTG